MHSICLKHSSYGGEEANFFYQIDNWIYLNKIELNAINKVYPKIVVLKKIE